MHTTKKADAFKYGDSMNSFLFISIGGIFGLVIGYLIAKAQSNRTIGGIHTLLDNEKKSNETQSHLLSDIKIELNKANELLQLEQKEKVKFETKYQEIDKQLQSYKEEFEKLKSSLQESTNTIAETQSQKTEAQTQLQGANITIGALNNTISKYESNIKDLQAQLATIKANNAELNAKYESSLKAIEEQKQFVNEANTALKEAFASLSSESLKSNNQSFLELAKTVLESHISNSKFDLENRQQAINSLVKPLSENLTNLDKKINEIENSRTGSYSELLVFLGNMQKTTDKLQSETNNLVSALKTSQVRGRYGEIGLRRIVEFSGMAEHCDFEEQVSKNTEDGMLRPDLIVNLPGQRRVIIDAKVPLSSYMQAFETTDEANRKEMFQQHARAVREHLKKLSEKNYWKQFKDSPDYVVMYLQIESSFGAAVQADPNLIEDAIKNNIAFATPTTLITLLKTVAFSWQQTKVIQNIYEIRDAGVELYNRIGTLIEYIQGIGSGLGSAVDKYNYAVGSIENRFIPQVRKLKEIGGGLMNKDIAPLKPIEISLRQIKNPLSSEVV
jgi:DNA recombination protein RmuC